MRRFKVFCALAVLGIGPLNVVSMAGEKEIPLSKVPKAVTDAFKAKYPRATIKKAIEESEDGKVTYEIESTISGGMSLDAELKADGTFIAVEKQIKTSDLPAAVATEVEARFPKAVIRKAEAVESDGKTTYETLIKKADGKSATLIFDKDGKFLEEEK